MASSLENMIICDKLDVLELVIGKIKDIEQVIGKRYGENRIRSICGQFHKRTLRDGRRPLDAYDLDRYQLQE